MEKQRIAVIGAGAIGGITAALMAAQGQDVWLVCKHMEIADLANGRGLHVTGFCGEHTVPVHSVAAIEELHGAFDLCLIATKAYDMPECARTMLPLLKPDALVVSMQNGICTDAMAAVVGKERTVGCVIGWGATMHGVGELEMTSGGDFVIGRLVPGEHPKMEALRQALSAVVETRISPDIYAELYSKLVVNSCITSLGAICGLHLGEMLKRLRAREIFLAVIGEAMNVAHAMQVKVPPFGGKLDYDKLMHGTTPLDELRRHVMLLIVGAKYSKLKSSSLQSLERGRPTEIDYFNGYIVQKGKEVGVDCPVNARLVTMVKEIERHAREINVKNLEDAGLTLGK